MTAGDFVVYHGHPADGDNPDNDLRPAAPWDEDMLWRAAQDECHVRVLIGTRDDWIGYDVTADTMGKCEISGGRGDKLGQPDPATVALTIEWDDAWQLPAFGNTVAVLGWLPGLQGLTQAALFWGHITDIAVEGDAPKMVSIVAVDHSRRMDGVYIGDTPWPAEWWDDRVAHVWAALRSKMRAPGWFPPWVNAQSQLGAGGLPESKTKWLARRDVDHRLGLELLEHYLQPLQAAFYFQPSTRWPAGADPANWAPTLRLVSGFSASADWQDPKTFIHECFVLADPPHRLWQNTSQVINEVRVRWLAEPPPGETDMADVDGTWAADDTLVDQYGHRGAQLDTEMIDPTAAGSGATWGDHVHTWGDPAAEWATASQPAAAAADTLARAWLARHEVPVWSCDKIACVLTRHTMSGQLDADIMSAWAVVAHGPGQMGRYINVGGIPSGFNLPGDTFPGGGWVVEGTTISWDPDGWVIELSCSHPSQYAGTILGQTAVLIRVLGGTDIGASALLAVRVYRPYDHEHVTTGTLVVNGVSWPNRPPVVIPGIGSTWVVVPSGPVGNGPQQITVEFRPSASGDHASSGTVDVVGHSGWVTWAEVPADTTWAQVPPATTWETALHRGDL